MIKKIILIFLFISINLSSFAYEDCMIFNKYKLTDINVEDNSIIDVCPLVTINNDKNVLIVHPFKTGKTRFCALKNSKSLVLFEVTVTDFATTINGPDGFEVLTLDNPFDEYEFELDKPAGVW